MKTIYYYVVTAIKSPELASAVSKLCKRIIKGLSDNEDDFPDQPAIVASFKSKTNVLDEKIALAKGNSLIKTERDALSRELYFDIRSIIPYVDGISKGNKTMVEKSGFSASKEAEKAPAPAAVEVKRVANGNQNNSAKIYIKADKYAKFYIVEMRITNNANSKWEKVLTTSDSRALIITGLERGVEVSFRVAAGNSVGIGAWSQVMTFIPQ